MRILRFLNKLIILRPKLKGIAALFVLRFPKVKRKFGNVFNLNKSLSIQKDEAKVKDNIKKAQKLLGNSSIVGRSLIFAGRDTNEVINEISLEVRSASEAIYLKPRCTKDLPLMDKR